MRFENGAKVGQIFLFAAFSAGKSAAREARFDRRVCILTCKKPGFREKAGLCGWVERGAYRMRRNEYP